MIKRTIIIILISIFLLNATGLSVFAKTNTIYNNHLKLSAKKNRLLDENDNGIDDLKEDLNNTILPKEPAESSQIELIKLSTNPSRISREVQIFPSYRETPPCVPNHREPSFALYIDSTKL